MSVVSRSESFISTNNDLLLLRQSLHHRRSTTTKFSVLLEDPPSNDDDETSIWDEAKLLLRLAAPTVGIQFGFSVPAFLVASYVGRHFGFLYLDGFTLANLTGNLFTLSLLQGLYTVADTLSPAAYASGDKREVGVIAIRGYVGSMMIILPIITALFLFIEDILVAIGEDEQASAYASRWYRIYALSVPFYALYMVTWKFLSAQGRLMPLLMVSTFSCAIILPLALNVLPQWFEFDGTALAILVFQAFEAVSLLFYLWFFQPHDVETFPGFGLFKQALQWKPFKEYMVLGAGGVLASSSWIYWELLAMLIGSSLGAVPLSIHAIPTQVLALAYMIPQGVGIALAVRLGSLLVVDASRAKKLAKGCAGASSVIFGIMALAMYFARDRIFRLFTSEQSVLDGADEIWGIACFYFFNTSMFGINMGVATALGMQWVLGTATVVSLWLLGLPCVYYFGIVHGGGLPTVWSCMWPPYLVINLSMIAVFVARDDAWHTASAISKDELYRLGLGSDDATADSSDEQHDDVEDGLQFPAPAPEKHGVDPLRGCLLSYSSTST